MAFMLVIEFLLLHSILLARGAEFNIYASCNSINDSCLTFDYFQRDGLLFASNSIYFLPNATYNLNGSLNLEKLSNITIKGFATTETKIMIDRKETL